MHSAPLLSDVLQFSLLPTDLPIKRYGEYELVTPVSTNLKGHYLSHILSANHKKRSPRDVSSNSEQLFFNITAFGRDFHLRLKPNTRFLAPGAVVEWHESAPVPGNTTDPGKSHQHGSASERIWRSEPLQTSCAYVGDIMDIPGTSVAISNCDGLVRLISLPVCVHMGVFRCWHSVCPQHRKVEVERKPNSWAAWWVGQALSVLQLLELMYTSLSSLQPSGFPESGRNFIPWGGRD